MSLFWVYLVFHWGDIVQNVLPKVRGSENDKRGEQGHIARYPIEGGTNPLPTMYFNIELTLRIDGGVLKKFKEIVITGILGLSLKYSTLAFMR